MGWTLDRWRASTVYEFNLAAGGYWRNWERFTKWAVREINYAAITGNPHIKKSNKPRSPRDLYELEIDKRVKKEHKQLAPEELEKIEKRLHGVKKSNSKD